MVISSLSLIVYFFSYKVLEKNNFSLISNYDSYNTADYFGILEIPKLKINNVIYKKNSKKNDVNINVYLVNDNSNLIVLASHSGSSPISYFKKLDKISEDDEIILKAHNRKRVYYFFKKELVKKTGVVKIKQYNYPVLVLITCSKTNKGYQEVYYTRLKYSENINKNSQKT